VAQFASYELTTIGQPIDRMAESAVAMLLERLDQPDQSNEHRVFEGRLIDGASIGPCPVIRAAG
jgi:DNA-binding LacI/PurR family transcriptional regulator